MKVNINKGLIQQSGDVSVLLLAKATLAIACIVWIGHSSVQLVEMLTAKPKPAVTNSVIPAATTNTSPPIDINALKSLPLFGEVSAAPVEPLVQAEDPEPKEETLEETRLNLVLKGLFTSDDEESGRAIVANGRQEALYQVGDEIQGLSNVMLSAVFFDRIKLDNRGKAEVLYLYPESESLANSAGKSSSTVSSPNISDQIDREISFDTTNRRPAKKLSEIMRVVRERDKTTGNMLGFRVLPGRDRESFTKSGLKVNDVITSIDGDALTDLRTAMSIYRDKREATQVSLLIRRDGNDISLDIDLVELNI
jgi:general secretion pathway protein C